MLLDNIRSVHNVGSIFRTAETIGVSKIYCLGTTPTPVDRFQRKRRDFVKVALGSEDLVPWEHVDNSSSLVKRLKKDGFRIIAVEQSEGSVNYKKIKPTNKSVIILGNEVLGVSGSLLKVADVIAEVPLKGEKESLNVSVVAGIALFQIFG